MDKLIVFFLVFIVEAIILILYGSSMFSPKRSIKSRIIMISIEYVLLFAISCLDIRVLNISAYFIANFFFLWQQYDLKLRGALFHSAIISVIMAASELAVYGIVGQFVPEFSAGAVDTYGSFLFIICSKALFFLVVFFISLLFRKRKNSQISDKSRFLLMIVPLTTVFILVSFSSICDDYHFRGGTYWLLFVISVLLLGVNLFIFGIDQYNQKKAQDYTDMKLLLQKESDLTEYYKMVLSQNENQRILIHDLKKHLRSIEVLNEKGSREEIKEYIDQILGSEEMKKDGRFCDRELLNAILLRYYRSCDEKGIRLSAEIRTGTTDSLEDSDITALFCNLLDNAVEASEGIENSFIELIVRKRENSPFILINLINSCNADPFTGPDRKLLTTKSDEQFHGLGLKSIEKVVRKYNGDTRMYYDENTGTFHTVITIRNSQT